MVAAEKQARMTAAEFRAFTELPENADKRFELHDGVVVEMPSGNKTHDYVIGEFFGTLYIYLKQNPIGHVTGDNNDFTLDDGNTYQPDVSVSLWQKYRSTAWDARYEFAPDLVVEVVSPSQSYDNWILKATRYLRFGTRLVWNALPLNRRVVAAWFDAEGNLQLREYGPDDMLDGGDVLSGFAVRVADLFPPPTVNITNVQ